MSNEYSTTRLRALQRRAFNYFPKHCNPENGLVADATREDAPASIAVVGFALSCYPVAIENGWIKRAEARRLALAALRFFSEAEQSTSRRATGHHGFYYHFLSMKTGRRVWQCELSTMDTALLLCGALTAAEYFDRDTQEERELREHAAELVARADWHWACNGGTRVALAWKPELVHHRDGFLKARWSGYNEGLLLQILALGAPQHALDANSYAAWCRTYKWKSLYGLEYLYAGPLFTHQFPHLWLDLRGIRDAFMQSKNCDYFENSRRATAIQQEYGRRNPRGFIGYNELCWGLTAGVGPGEYSADGVRGRRFWEYRARGVPFGPDDGTLSPWAVIASLPFAPEIVLPSLNYIERTYPAMSNHYGLHCSFNPTFGGHTKAGWIASEYLGLDQGPLVLAIENHLSGLIWKLLRSSAVIRRGLCRAGFGGGWLDAVRTA
jgi:hypothetical protein